MCRRCGGGEMELIGGLHRGPVDQHVARRVLAGECQNWVAMREVPAGQECWGY